MTLATSSDPCRKYLVYRRPQGFVSRSGLAPLADVVGAEWLSYPVWKWWVVYNRFWRTGFALRDFGRWFYGTEWNERIPVLGDIALSRAIDRCDRSLVHFIFAEFAAPRWSGLYRRRGAQVVGTFHASINRQVKVHGRMKLDGFDWISVVSQTQMPFFLDRGYPEDRLRVTRHGVDTEYFRPDPHRPPVMENGCLQGLLVGSTERDHAFAAEVMKALPKGIMQLSVATREFLWKHYEGVSGVTLLPYLDDDTMLKAYQHADLLVMPLEGATANNALLESMACGTPVMVNRIGGVPEYVQDEAGWLLPSHDLDAWVFCLCDVAMNPDKLLAKRTTARKWAEQMSWSIVASDYLTWYRDVMEKR